MSVEVVLHTGEIVLPLHALAIWRNHAWLTEHNKDDDEPTES